MAKKAKKSMSKAARSARVKASWAARRQAAAAGVDKWKAMQPADPGLVSAAAFTAPGYEQLAAELQHAFSQSAHGKGKHRHSNGRSFDRQPIMELGRLYGPGFAAGQAAKKTQEALGMLARGENDAAIAELHGAIVYIAATAALVRELPAPTKKGK